MRKPIIRRHRLLNSILGLLLLFLGSCSNAVFDKTEKIPNSVWLSNQPLRFDFEIKDTSRLYDIVLQVNHGTDFEFQNFYTLVQISSPDQPKPRIDTLSIELSDPVGAWYGKCSGNNCEISLAFLTQASFPQAGKYSLQLQQFNRQDSLAHLHSLRLQVLPNELRKGELNQPKK